MDDPRPFKVLTDSHTLKSEHREARDAERACDDANRAAAAMGLKTRYHAADTQADA